MDLTICPACGALAEVEWRSVLESTDSPVEHAKIRCAQLHWFLLPVARLAAPRLPAAHEHTAVVAAVPPETTAAS